MIPEIPEHAPFSAAQRSWLNGFFAGLFSVQTIDNGPPARPGIPVTILYGSQTGTAEGLARRASKRLRASGFEVDLRALDDCEPAALQHIARLLVITSTHGDGEMPDNAGLFWEALTQNEMPALTGVAFSVLALGDASYADFCLAGKCIDARLETLGARRIYPRTDCDVDFEEPFRGWLDGVLSALQESSVPLPARAA